ncbi:MAG: SpoIIE family protein phosphatase [Bacteroidales bacterium]
MNKIATQRQQLSNFKLNALLTVTQAINENTTVENLLKLYKNLLQVDLSIERVILFKLTDGKWDVLFSWGDEVENYKMISVEKDLSQYTDITTITNPPEFMAGDFPVVVPVFRNTSPIAYLIIGDLEEKRGMSPVVKHLPFVQTLSNIILVAIENIRMFNQLLHQEALKKELELASRMQTMLIPRNDALPRNQHIHCTSFYHPHSEVGGDYYDCLLLNKDEVGFCIADVSGKGISAAILMSNFQANLRALFTHEISLPALVERLNERVMSSANGEKFITLFIAKYNYRTRELNFVNAGHNPPVLYQTQQKKLSFLQSGCVGMGMLDEIPGIRQGSLSIDEHTKIICYTDGLVEVIDDTGVGFGTAVLEENISNTNTIKENIDSIVHSRQILEGSTAIFDDITILGVEFF